MIPFPLTQELKIDQINHLEEESQTQYFNDII